MSLRYLSALALPLFAAACSAQSAEPAASSTQDQTAAWLNSLIPHGGADETGVLTLVNDRTRTEADYTLQCSFTSTQAAAIVSYRNGDDTIAASDDQRFDTLSELDALPFTDSTFWINALACERLHPSAPNTCATVPTVIELVVDESGSMSGEKWDATRDALLATLAQIQQTSGEIYVGVLPFDDSPLSGIAPKPMSEADTYDNLVEVLDIPTPHGGGTGTEKALEAGYKALERVNIFGARKVIVLLSDGSPSGGDSEKDACTTLVSDSHAAGVDLFSVGIGPFPSDSSSGYDAAFMGRIAQAGGTAPAGCDPVSTDVSTICHYQVTPGVSPLATKQSLLTALTSIRTSVATCP